MPPVFRFYIMHCAIGFVAAGFFVAGIMYLNVANLWTLISKSDVGFLALFVFWVLNGSVFAGVQTAVAVMLMADKDDDDDDGPRGGLGVPVAVRAEASARRG